MSEKYGIYLAIHVSECSVGESGTIVDSVENFALIKAFSPEEAEQKAADNANNENTSYKNEYGETVTWVVKPTVTVREVMLGEEIDLHSDIVDFFARGFKDYKSYQSLYDVVMPD
jgi:type IV secretory pathway component VirB8